MFTGLVEERGSIRSVRKAGRSLHLTVGAKIVLDGIRLGDSIAVNGVCLTVVQFDGDSFTVDVIPETYTKTNLHSLSSGSLVNLERTMALGDRFGGHIVQGHVDGTGTLLKMEQDEIAMGVTVKAPDEILRYIVPKGSITIDGISLTVVDVGVDQFRVSLIPHTFAMTNLGGRKPGEHLNLEVDILAKYVERMLRGHLPETAPTGPSRQSGVTEALLRENGFA